MDFHVIHRDYTQIIWEEVAFIWKVTGKAVAIFMTGTIHTYIHIGGAKPGPNRARPGLVSVPRHATLHSCLGMRLSFVLLVSVLDLEGRPQIEYTVYTTF